MADEDITKDDVAEDDLALPDSAAQSETPSEAQSDDGQSDDGQTDDGLGLTQSLDIGGEASAPEVERPAPVIRGKLDKFGIAMGTGRRKTAVARVRIKDGSGQIMINERPLAEFFPLERDQRMIQAPLNATETLEKVDIWVHVKGGGSTGQTGAVVLGIARALQARNTAFHASLSEGGFLTRDSRMVERKKYGHKKARRSFQFSKR